MRKQLLFTLILSIFLFSCSEKKVPDAQTTYTDIPYRQDYSIKYNVTDSGTVLHKAYADRNGVIQILSSKGLLHPFSGAMLYPGTLVPDDTYRPMKDKKIAGIRLYQNQLVYLDDKAVFSNAWAGSLYSRHGLPGAAVFAGGDDFAFLISDGSSLQYLQHSQVIWESKSSEQVLDIAYDSMKSVFFVLTPGQIFSFSPADKQYTPLFKADSLICFTIASEGKDIIAGTHNGYIIIDASTGKQKGEINRKLPWTALTAVTEIEGKLWFGSPRGAFMLKDDGKFNYYASKRWLPSDNVKQIVNGGKDMVLILTDAGLAKICFKTMTLEDKAVFFDKQVRKRHIRNGFNATLVGMKDGNLGTGHMEDSDNDGLWTSMYLGAEAFRYAVTKSPEALQNCRESLDAMERLYSVNPVKGFPARSYERRGYKLHDPEKWIPAPDPEWDWKSTTSSDEAIGHIFVFAVLAELVDDEAIKERSVALIDSLMQHVVDNDLYLVDWDGKPTLWGKWNPEYVNARPKNVGDRKINSSNIIAMLQTAYHFTKKEIYKEKAFELMDKHGYLENLMRPMKEIGPAPADADDWSKMLSHEWNHSDDEMYFLGYWGLYRYAFNDTLKEKYKEAIIDHWEIERPEKEGAWNIFTALTGTKEFDLEEAVWYLQEYPLDMIGWTVRNSERKDIELVEPNFRGQTTKEVLPPDELDISRHNGNRFDLNGGRNGNSEYSAGDIWLLPYWMGRYLEVISAPANKQMHR
ncbi:hypothetical protein [Agriterribacter sp.]|uniref:hypothetical protein n=1 Tax=Agriterribacter sp. TaxID=2821509 RepID=UPI002C12F102|nr:hypothetical protein [Agriterribacter sp.]HRP56821.1 hypothetical protein [Agriterribacter sp.]